MPLPWNKTKKRKKILGVCTFWVSGYFPFGALLFALLVFGVGISLGYLTGIDKSHIGFIMIPCMILFLCIHMGTILLGIILFIMYLIDVLMNKTLRETPKVLWALAVFFGSYFANVFYWYLYVWREPPFTLPSLVTSEANVQYKSERSIGKKIGLGILTIIPILNFILMIIAFISLFVAMILTGNSGNGNQPPPLFFVFFISIFVLVILGMVFVWCLLIYYVRSILKNTGLTEEKKELWVSILMLGRSFALPFYWYWYIWKEPETGNSVPATVNP